MVAYGAWTSLRRSSSSVSLPAVEIQPPKRQLHVRLARGVVRCNHVSGNAGDLEEERRDDPGPVLAGEAVDRDSVARLGVGDRGHRRRDLLRVRLQRSDVARSKDGCDVGRVTDALVERALNLWFVHTEERDLDDVDLGGWAVLQGCFARETQIDEAPHAVVEHCLPA